MFSAQNENFLTFLICLLEFSEIVPDDRYWKTVLSDCFEFFRKIHIIPNMG